MTSLTSCGKEILPVVVDTVPIIEDPVLIGKTPDNTTAIIFFNGNDKLRLPILPVNATSGRGLLAEPAGKPVVIKSEYGGYTTSGGTNNNLQNGESIIWYVKWEYVQVTQNGVTTTMLNPVLKWASMKWQTVPSPQADNGLYNLPPFNPANPSPEPILRYKAYGGYFNFATTPGSLDIYITGTP